jgi:tetraacyldisaccharide 4'-kinase
MILLPVSLLFCLLVKLRHFAYQQHWLTTNHFNLPVIVVGNIYVGGNGKTPFVIWLAEQLKRQGIKPAIVSRGYGASREGAWPREVLLDGDISRYGDEPYLIKKQTGCPVMIDPVRSRAIQKILQNYNCEVIISDDGLQHYAMSRFIEINITDSKRQYGNRFCLPAGPLREPCSRLQQVDYIVYNRNQETFTQDIEKDNEYLMSYDFDLLYSLDGKKSVKLEKFKDQMVHAVAGIGDPPRFFSLLSDQGIGIIEHSFADHFFYTEKDLVFSDSYPVIMTEKDAVKCTRFNLDNCWYLPIRAQIEGPLSENIVKKLRNYHG